MGKTEGFYFQGPDVSHQSYFVWFKKNVSSEPLIYIIFPTWILMSLVFYVLS